MAGKIQSPEKELRFTRSGQASIFWVVSAILITISITLLTTSIYRDINPEIPHPVWAIIPLLLALILVKLAIRLTRHAYLILTPLGIEIFPFFRPTKSMQLVTWQEVTTAEVNEKLTRLTLHYDAEKSSGIHFSLAPIRSDRRSLLVKAVIGRLSPGSESLSNSLSSSCAHTPDRSFP
jgi:hypothetical protein